MTKTRIAINGFGRIGRLAARIAVERDDLELVAINDLASTEALTYLFKHDSVQGRFAGEAHLEGETLFINGAAVRMTAHRDPLACAWGDLGVDILLECTGVFLTRERNAGHFESGAKKVLLSAPAKEKDILTVCLGVNEGDIGGDDTLISNASCTTNCVAPPLKALHDAFVITNGMINTTHAYTMSQALLDSPQGKDLRAGRAAALNLVPSTTGAARAVGLVLPDLAGKLDGMAVRTPNATGSLVDMTLLFERVPSVEEAHAVLAAYAEANPTILKLSYEPLVSTDVIGLPYSSIVDGLMTMKVGPLLKVLSWYDNEAGYATRLVDLAQYVASV